MPQAAEFFSGYGDATCKSPYYHYMVIFPVGQFNQARMLFLVIKSISHPKSTHITSNGGTERALVITGSDRHG